MSANSDFSWQDYGACVDLPDAEFDPFVSIKDSEAVKRNKKICSECSVREECLSYGYSTRSEGMWGGKFTADPGERRSIALYNSLKSANITVSTQPVVVDLPAFKLQIP